MSYIRINRARYTLYKKILDLLDEGRVSGITNRKFMLRNLSAPDATSLHHSRCSQSILNPEICASNLKSTIIFWPFIRRVFSEYTEVNATALEPLDTILPRICAFIVVLCGLK